MSQKLLSCCPPEHQATFAAACGMVDEAHADAASKLVGEMQAAGWSWTSINAWFVANWPTVLKILSGTDSSQVTDAINLIVSLAITIFKPPSPAPTPAPA